MDVIRPLIACERCHYTGTTHPGKTTLDREGKVCADCGATMVEFAPSTDSRGAVSREDAGAALAAWDAFRADNNLDGMTGFEEACGALNSLRGQYDASPAHPSQQLEREETDE